MPDFYQRHPADLSVLRRGYGPRALQGEFLQNFARVDPLLRAERTSAALRVAALVNQLRSADTRRPPPAKLADQLAAARLDLAELDRQILAIMTARR